MTGIIGWLIILSLAIFIKWFWEGTAGWIDKKNRKCEIENLKERYHNLACAKLSQDTFIVFVKKLLEELDLEINYIDDYHTHIKRVFSYPSEMYELKKKKGKSK